MSEADTGSTRKLFGPGQKVFDRYTLKKMIGRGGMGVVWLARDEKLERDVALKFLPEVVVFDPKAIHELKREARRNLELTHPHIVRIYDFVDDSQAAAIAMEYVDGDSLSKLSLEQPGGCFDMDRLRPWVEQLCAALSYAHEEARVVHRDLKPANLMLDGRGRLKVTDFGIARSISDSVSRVSVVAGSSGTLVYMSPQQLLGEQPAATDDIYSLGATLYELLTGKPPFHSGDIGLQVQEKVPPPVSKRRRELGFNDRDRATPFVSKEWEDTIAACLAKDPADRPQSAADVAVRLGLAAPRSSGRMAASAPDAAAATDATPQTTQPAPVPQPSRSALPLMAGTAAAVLLIAGFGWFLGSHRTTRPTTAGPVSANTLYRPSANDSPAITPAPAPATTGGLVVRSTPPGARVDIGEGRSGPAPYTLGDAAPGRYSIRVTAPGYEDWLGEVDVRASQFAEVDASLLRSTGRVILLGSPAGAEVTDGTRRIGVLPLTLEAVPIGPAQFTVASKGYQSTHVSGDVTRNGELRLTAVLKKVPVPEPGRPWKIDDLALAMAAIPAGSFILGSDKGDWDERPLTNVSLSRPFWIGTTEITQAQWEALMGRNPSHFKGADQPVEQVSWKDAVEFCHALTQREQSAGRLPQDLAYTLPTEAQWEYCSRAGSGAEPATDLGAAGWYSDNSGNKTHDVGGKAANAWGLHDMQGNVWELCLDWYGNYPGGSVTDPEGAKTGTRRSVRGGSWNSVAKRCRVTVRDGWNTGSSSDNLGFRIVLVPSK